MTISFCLSSHLNLIFNKEKVKDVLLFIKNDHNYYMNRPENKILQFYTAQGNKVVLCYLTYICSTVLAFLMISTISLVTDLIVPSNHSKEISLPVIADYGVDTQQYFYYVFICICITVFIIGVVIFTTYSAYMLYVQHACALFAIVSYQLRTMHILDTSSLINLKDRHLLEKYKNVELSQEEKEKIFRKLLLCIKEHKNAIRYSNLLESLFTKFILTQIFFHIICLSIGGVGIVLNLGNTDEITRFGSLALVQVIHIFILCLPGQRLLNHSEEVYVATCEIVWYMLPKKFHNLYMFLIARTMIFSKITAFKIAVMSMETFLAIIQTTMSYFTMLLSTI
ncbi:odorant receptor 13a isoform X2 [Bombus terrestris]|uniref:Odorant receptor 13a isoform X2 n=1 Tax=Bombus terrestris TaxID=30195 RepID=A0A9B2JJS8_BOMTE|nr:odorant receptor 13a isoform X2 [Bombus terrestris]